MAKRLQYYIAAAPAAPFSTDTKNTLILDFLTQKENTKFMIFTSKHTNSHFFDTSLKSLTPALLVLLVTNMRFANYVYAGQSLRSSIIF